MWMGFANGIINGLYPMSASTESFDIFKVIWQTFFYFGPHLLISFLILKIYGNETFER